MKFIWLFLAFFAFAAIVCIAVTPLVRSLALRFGLVDVPDGRRKLHARPIPVAGGVAIFITSVIALGSLFVFSGTIKSVLADPNAEVGLQQVVAFGPELIGLLIAACIIALVGVADDLVGLRGRTKFLGQLLAVAVTISSGVVVERLSIFDNSWELGRLSKPLTAFWLLGAINSLNLIDGLDGLLGTIGCIVCGSFAALAYWNHQFQAAFVATAVAGSLVGFLFYNFPPATIFLGDCGSMLVGLVVGVLGIQSSLKGAATVSLAAPAALLIIPIFDTSAAIVRRKLTGRSIFTTDRAHLHHRLMESGRSNRRVLLLVGALCVLASVGALASQWFKNEMIALLSVLMIVGLLIVTRLFGHSEFLLIKEHLLDAVRGLRHGKETGHVHQHAVRLQGSAAWEELWRNITVAAESMQLKTICLDVNAPSLKEGYHARWGRVQSDVETPCYWKTEIPLAARGQFVGRLEVVAMRNGAPLRDLASQVCKLVEDVESAMDHLTAPEAAVRQLREQSIPPNVVKPVQPV